MAVISVKEVWNGRRATQAAEIDEYERVFRVITNNTLDGSATALNAVGLPQILDLYADPNGTLPTTASGFPEVVCVKREPSHDQDDPFVWFVRCTYTSDLTQTPWTLPPEVEWYTEKIQIPLLKEPLDAVIEDPAEVIDPYVPAAVVNSAGELFDPPPMVEVALTCIRLRRNELAWDWTTLEKYVNSTNAKEFLGKGKDSWFMDDIRAQKVRAGTLEYYKTEYVMKYSPLDWGWLLRIYDMGFNELITDPNDATKKIRQPILVGPGLPVSTAHPLDGAGRKLTILSNKPIWDQVVMLDFFQHKTKDWGPLNLPAT